MARVPYGKITKAIQDVLDNDIELRKLQATVDCGKPPVFGIGMFPHIGIYERPRYPTPGQTIAGGSRLRYTLNWDVWIATFSGAGYQDAVDLRDEVISLVEIILMSNRDLGGVLANRCLNLGGGDLRSGPGTGGGFIAEGSLSISAEVEATTM